MANGRNSDAVLASSGNVFADLGLHDADEKQTRVRLAVAVNQVIKEPVSYTHLTLPTIYSV